MEITMDMIKALREQTHAGIMDCKKALQSSNGDFEKAEEYLKKVGLAAVEKRVDRATDNGRVTFVITDKKAVMVDVSCETDFVARNDQFKELGVKICNIAIETGSTQPTEAMEDLVKGLIATINENMKIKKLDVIDIPANGYVQGYSHADGNIGVLVSFTASNTAVYQSEAFKTFAFNTAMHVCAASPMYLKDADVPKDYEDKQLEIFQAQVAGMDKPAKVLEGIVRGKLKKHYADICLLDQVFQISNDEGLSVSQLLAKFNKENGSDLQIVGYKRFLAGA
ncbi:MAG: translation elongation factor Ts [Sphaerochaetaceae bacterium]|nr:translation elongation factor Ts [Sphaerochaetaceae bacterium]